MDSRLELHEELCTLFPTIKVYFQPPESVTMSYPCIRYSKDVPDVKQANNNIYMDADRYSLVVIDPDPDSTIADDIRRHYQMCRIVRRYVADNLNHTVLDLYH